MRILARPAQDPQSVRLQLLFAAPEHGEPLPPARAALEFGDGQVADLGLVVPSTAATWRTQRTLDLAEHTYAGSGPYTVRLLLNVTLLEIQIRPGLDRAGAPDQPADSPVVQTLSIDAPSGRPLERSVTVEVQGLQPGQHLRLDGGAGQAWWLDEATAPVGPWERRLAYAKSGFYTLGLDVVDDDGFWLQTLAEQPVEVAAWPADSRRPTLGTGPGAGPAPVLVGDQPGSAAEPGPTAAGPQPWQPFRYARPLWGWVRTYTSPGGATVARVLAMGSYLSIRDEMLVGSSLWYKTAGRDWIQAGALDTVYPSQLRGIECALSEPQAAVGPAPRQGTVTATLLNVRRRPGVRADNPPVSQLPSGTSVVIHDEALYGGATWYCVGHAGWVYGPAVHVGRYQGAAVRAPTLPTALPIGWVTAPALNVRPRPGVAADNPPIDVLAKNQAVAVLETRMLGSVPWHAVGHERWVDGSWLRVARVAGRPSAIAGHRRWVAVSLAEQTAVAYEGDRPVFAMLISTGLHATPTPTGLFQGCRRLEADRVAGGNPAWGSYYDLEDVPWINYFHTGYALLGAYWHDDFGRPHSHGCVNLSLYDAWWIYRWSAGGSLAIYIS